MTNLSVLKYKPPVVKIELIPHHSRNSSTVPVSSSFVVQPEQNITNLPPLLGVSSVTNSAAVPALAGSAPAAGTNVAAGGTTPSATFGSSSFDPLTKRTYADNAAVSTYVGYQFLISTSFSPGMSSSGATAVLFSDSGSPTWAGTSVPLNGSFRLDPKVLTVGDIVRVKVTPAAPNAALIGYSNEVSFLNPNVSFARKHRPISGDSGGVVSTTNYVYWVHTSGTNQKLYRMDKATETPAQAVNLLGDTTNDQIILLGAIGDVVFFRGDVGGGVLKLYSVTEALVITLLSNTRNNVASSDNIAQILPIHNRDTILSNNGSLTLNNNIYFQANNANGVAKMFRVNGSGTIVQVTNTTGNQTTADFSTTQVIVFNGAIFSVQNNASAVTKLFKITTADVVTQIGDHRNSSVTTDNITLRRANANFMYYTANNLNGVLKLFRVNTSDVPAMVVNMTGNQATSDSYNSVANGQAIFNGSYYFFASTDSTTNLAKLYKVDDAGTISNIGAPFVKSNSTAFTIDNNALMQAAGSILLLLMGHAEGTMLYYITSSDVITRADQTFPYSSYSFLSFDTSFVLNSRTFVQMVSMIDTGARALFEVLPTTFRLRQLINTGLLAATNGVNAAVVGNTVYSVFGGISYLGVAKMTVS